jgi:adenylosuccinate lyase
MQHVSINEAVAMLANMLPKGRNLQMSGDPHYQPEALRPYLGYDNRTGWLVLVEWFWMVTLAFFNIIPKEHAALLTPELLQKLLRIKMTDVTKIEREVTRHDILALLRLMRRILPKELHRYLHFGCTSYDIICTAYALQAMYTFRNVLYPMSQGIDLLWRKHIATYEEQLQNGHTHLQIALPVTVGCWLTPLHSRFVKSVRRASRLSRKIPGKFSGAVGTSAAIRALFGDIPLEQKALEILTLPSPQRCTQVTQPEDLARFYYEITLVSAALANLGDDVRHLQMTEVGEVVSASSTSSTMSHKTSNPIAAEQVEGMHISVRCEDDKITQTLNSTLQRVLTGSNVMRSYSAVMVFTYQQFETTHRLLRTFAVDGKRCDRNFIEYGRLSVAELLHLALQWEGILDPHSLVNKKIVPRSRMSGQNLREEMDLYARRTRSKVLRDAWANVSADIKEQLQYPETYLGDAVSMAQAETRNELLAL